MKNQKRKYTLNSCDIPDPSDLVETYYYENIKKECDSCGLKYFLDKFNSDDPDGYCDDCLEE